MTLDVKVNSLIGSVASGRCYNLTAPSGVATPFVVWQRIAEVPIEDHGETDYFNYSQASVQVSCYAKTYAEANALRIEVVNAIWSGVKPSDIRAEAMRDSIEDASQPRLYRCDLDLAIFVENPIDA